VLPVAVKAAEAEGDDNMDKGEGSDKGSNSDNNHRNSMDMDNNTDNTGMCSYTVEDGVAGGIEY
jgi:hypothetical protein